MFNCYFSPQKEPHGSERFEHISINSFYPAPSAWWPAQSPSGQAPHLRGYQEYTALPVTWSKRPNRERSLSAESLSEAASQSRISGAAGQCSLQLFPSKEGISASQASFTCISLLRPCQQGYLGLSLLMWKNQHKQESSPVRGVFFSISWKSYESITF